jgi:hypothetical protein
LRVLLINGNSKADILAAPPIGLSYVACAASDAGHEVKVLDLCFVKDRIAALGECVKVFGPQVVGLSIRNLDNVNMLHPASYVADYAELVMETRRLTKAPIVIGGSGASLCPAEVLAKVRGDYIIVSDGERSFVELLSGLERNAGDAGIPGVGSCHDGRFILAPPELREFNSGNPGLGRWVDMAPYHKVGSSYNVQTRRGCTRDCIYCSYNQILEGKRLRLRPARDVVDEIEEALFTHKPESFEFVDSVFNDPVDHCVEILEEIVRRPWKADFTAMGVSPRGVDLPLLKLMWRAGFSSFMMSPESASPAVLQSYRKGHDLDDLKSAALAIRRTRFTVLWYFLLGGPGETDETLDETLSFTERYLVSAERPPYNMANFFLGVRVYPRTQLWRVAVKEGMFSETADPLRQTWYVSPQLDIERTVRKLTDAARRRPEIVLGFDERLLTISRALSSIADLVGIPKPYWRHFWGVNQILIKLGLRTFLFPNDAASKIHDALRAQGATGFPTLLQRS